MVGTTAMRQQLTVTFTFWYQKITLQQAYHMMQEETRVQAETTTNNFSSAKTQCK